MFQVGFLSLCAGLFGIREQCCEAGAALFSVAVAVLLQLPLNINDALDKSFSL